MKYLSLLFVCLCGISYAQPKLPFAEEVEALQKKYDTLWDPAKETIVFAGSSSIKFWKDLETVFPEHHIVNSGFGGSKASDLLLHTDALILRYKPKQVFLYEGDNDVAGKENVKTIIGTTKKIIAQIKAEDATTAIVIIAAKPSIARWHLRRKYKKLNKHFKRLCNQDAALTYGNVWNIMLNKGKVKNDIFIEDGLHMNKKGYQLWYTVIAPLIN